MIVNGGISAQWAAERLLFPLRLGHPGVNLPSQGGLERGVHPPAVRLLAVLACFPLDISLLSMLHLGRRLMGRSPFSSPGQETLGFMRKL